MGTRTIDAPGDGLFCTTRQAAAYLSLSLSSFKRLVGLGKGKGSKPALPWLAEWLRPVPVGRAVRWHWLDVVALGQILTRLREGGSAVPDLGPDDEEDDED